MNLSFFICKGKEDFFNVNSYFKSTLKSIVSKGEFIFYIQKMIYPTKITFVTFKHKRK